MPLEFEASVIFDKKISGEIALKSHTQEIDSSSS